LDNFSYPFSFLVPLLDLLILFHLRPELCCFLEQVVCHVDLLFYLLYLLCWLLFPLLPHLRWSGRCELLSKILDLLLVLIDFLHNLINILCHREFGLLRGLCNFLVGYDHFLLQSLHAFLLFFCLELSLLEYQFHLVLMLLYLLQFYCICACTRLYLLCNTELQFIQCLGWYPRQYQLQLSQIL
jgi:hypothetical protein